LNTVLILYYGIVEGVVVDTQLPFCRKELVGHPLFEITEDVVGTHVAPCSVNPLAHTPDEEEVEPGEDGEVVAPDCCCD